VITIRISQDQLLQAVIKAGLDPASSDGLKRLRRAGLLQPGVQEHHPDRRGSETFYPQEAAAQLVGVLRLKAEVRAFDQLRFWAWWEGLWVDPRQLRNTLMHWVATETRPLRDHLGSHGDPDEAADAVARAFGIRNRSGPGWLQRRVGPAMTGSALYLLIQLMAGGQPDWNGIPFDDPSQIPSIGDGPDALLYRAIGFPSLATPISNDIGPLVEHPPPVDELFDQLQETNLLDMYSWLQAVRTASLQELERARQLARTFLVDGRLWAAAVKYQNPDLDDLFGLGHLDPNPPRNGATLRQYVLWIPIGVLLRRNFPSDRLDEIIEAMASSASKIRSTPIDLGLDTIPDPP
jgi:hypothetical protein